MAWHCSLSSIPVCSEVTSQAAIVAAGQDSWENGMLGPGQLAYRTTQPAALCIDCPRLFQVRKASMLTVSSAVDGTSLELCHPNCSEPYIFIFSTNQLQKSCMV